MSEEVGNRLAELQNYLTELWRVQGPDVCYAHILGLSTDQLQYLVMANIGASLQ